MTNKRGRKCGGKTLTQTYDTPLTKEDILSIKQLLKALKIIDFDMTESEIRAIVPEDHKRIKEMKKFKSGGLGLNSAMIFYRDETLTWVNHIELQEFHPMDATKIVYEDLGLQHFNYLFSFLLNHFGFEWIVKKIKAQMIMKYEALSPGQADAVICKFIVRAREDGSTMDSLTRSQLHKLRQKIDRYEPLVTAFAPLLVPERPPNQLFALGDERVELAKSPSQLDKKQISDEITQLRNKLKAKGVDPDNGLNDEDEDDLLLEDHERVYFECSRPNCNHKEDYQLDEDGGIIQMFHHGYAMILRSSRRTSDY